MRKYALYPEQEFNRTMRTILILIVLAFVSFAAAIVFASPALLDSQTMNNGDGTETFMSQSGGWWQDDSGNVQRTDSSLKPSDGVWDIENTSAPHKVYAATDEVRWRVDPPAGESAGFEIAFSTVSLYLFDEVNGDDERTINWSRPQLNTMYDGSTIRYNILDDGTLYVTSTPEGYKTNLFIESPSRIPSPTSVEYFGANINISDVYFAIRYSVSHWPEGVFRVDGTEYGPGSITEGYSAVLGDDDLWMLPTKAYRNVKDFNGQSWRDAEDESYVYYVFDRLAQEILVLAPYTLCVGADNILIDPTTWTSGRTDSDSASWVASNAATTNFGSDTLVDVGYNSSTQRHGFIKFASLPSNPNVTNVSATMILFYQGQSTAASMSTVVSRLLRDWVESEVTYNVYSTGNSWGTAGANNSTTDYDGSTATVYAWGDAANFVVNDATLNTLVEGWIEGTYPNYGLNLFRNGSTVTDYKDFNSDDYATGSARPHLAITYTSSSTFGGWTDVDVQAVGSGGMIGVSLICPATITYLVLADVILDVTGLATTPAGASYLLGEGSEADYNWDYSIAADTIDGATAFILGASISLELPTQLSLYLESGKTGATDERYFTLDWGGGSGSGSTDVLDAISDLSGEVLVNRDVIWDITSEVDAQAADISARIASVSGDVRATWPMIASVSTDVDAQHVLTRAASGSWIANATSLISEASASAGLKIDAVAADADIVLATLALMNNYVKVSRAYYNTATALTNGEFLRDVPASALSHVESRWFAVQDVIDEDWASYAKREFTIYSYPDSAAGTTLASHLIPSTTAPTERTWVDNGASLW